MLIFISAAFARGAIGDDLPQPMPQNTMPPLPPSGVSAGLNPTVLKVHVTTDGKVDECSIEHSSGDDHLDQDTCEYVKTHWRWEPIPSPATTTIAIRWQPKDAPTAHRPPN
jgi:TonB family protein